MTSHCCAPPHPRERYATSRQGAFARATPFPHVVIDDFLTPAFADRLLATFPPFARGNAVGDGGNQGGKSVFEPIVRLGGAYAELDRLIQSRAWLEWLGRATGISGLLYDPWYLGGGTHENRESQGLDPHIDFNYHPSERWHRRLNLIVYLNRDWDASFGGRSSCIATPRATRHPWSSSRPPSIAA